MEEKEYAIAKCYSVNKTYWNGCFNLTNDSFEDFIVEPIYEKQLLGKKKLVGYREIQTGEPLTKVTYSTSDLDYYDAHNTYKGYEKYHYKNLGDVVIEITGNTPTQEQLNTYMQSEKQERLEKINSLEFEAIKHFRNSIGLETRKKDSDYYNLQIYLYEFDDDNFLLLYPQTKFHKITGFKELNTGQPIIKRIANVDETFDYFKMENEKHYINSIDTSILATRVKSEEIINQYLNHSDEEINDLITLAYNSSEKGK